MFSAIPKEWIPNLFTLIGVALTLVTQRFYTQADKRTAQADKLMASDASVQVAKITSNDQDKAALWTEIGALRQQCARLEKEADDARKSEGDCKLVCARLQWEQDLMREELAAYRKEKTQTTVLP